MTNSYKMVVLEYLLQKGPSDWYLPVTSHEVAPYFHNLFMSKNYRKRIDLSNKTNKQLWEYEENKVASWIARMAMTRWVRPDGLVYLENNELSRNVEAKKGD